MEDESYISTRDKVLQTILRQHRCTINDLAEAVEINPISVRHHIAKLQADGLVASEEERHGVGRPRRVYFLTEAGLEHFPTRYLRLTIRLLQQLKEHLPAPMVSEIFMQMATGIVEDYAQAVDANGLSMEQRLEMVKDILTKEGFSVEWERFGDQYHIREISCPYLQVGQTHREVCWVDQTLISSLLALPAEKIKCVLDGDQHCTYVVPSLETEKFAPERVS